MSCLGSLEDRMAIRELQEKYGDAVIRMNKDDWLLLWDDNATWVVMGIAHTGKPAIEVMWNKFYTPYNQERGNLTRFYTSIPGVIDIDHINAAARLYVSVLIVSDTDGGRNYYFSCSEEYTKIGAVWRIKKRLTKRLYPPLP